MVITIVFLYYSPALSSSFLTECLTIVSFIIIKTDNITTWCQKCDTMATFRLQPPAPFSFKCLDEWQKCFEQFRTASGLAGETGEKQVNTLLYAMGEAEDTLASANPTAAERRDYDKVVKKFNEFFKVRKNVIFERARFNKRCQGSEESVDQFITSL